MTFKFSNFGQAVLQADILSGDLSMNLGTEAVAVLPTLGASEVVRLSLYDGVSTPEIVEVTAISGSGVCTMLRGQEGSTARAWVSGTRVRCALTADVLTQAFSAIKIPAKYGTATFSAGLYTVLVDSLISLPLTGQFVTFIVPNASTGASTVRFTDGGSFSSTYPVLFNGADTAADDIKATQLLALVFTGTAFEILSITNKLTPNALAITAPAFIPSGTSVPSAGLYAPVVSGAALAAGGVGRFFVDASGNIGIGTSVPETDLHVKKASAEIKLEATSGQPNFFMKNGANTWEFILYPAGLTEYYNGTIIREISGTTSAVGTQASADTAQVVYGVPTGATQYGQALLPKLSGTALAIGEYVASTLAAGIACASYVQSYIKNITKGAGAAITLAKGLYIENITAGVTNWGIWAEGPQHKLLGEIYVNVFGPTQKLGVVPYSSAIAAGTQVIASGADTLVAFGTEVSDPLNLYTNTAGNYKFTAPLAGVYQINAGITSPLTAGNNFVIRIYKNGALYNQFGANSAAAAVNAPLFSSVNAVAAVNDTFQVYFFQDSGAPQTITANQFNVSLISRV